MLKNRISKEKLEVVAGCIDINNPKWEFNYMLVGKKYLVSTNTRVLAQVEHKLGTSVGKEFFIHKTIVDLAIKQRYAVSFELQEQKIICFNKEGGEIITFSIEEQPDRFPGYKFGNYERIVPEKFNETFPFIEHSHIQGIFAIQRVHVDPKHIPKKMQKGKIGINERNLPVQIANDNEEIKVIIMPIIDSFSELEGD
jgi:hypothetical protein